MAMCVTTFVTDHMYPLPQVETSHGQVWYYCAQAALWSDVTPHMRLQARFAFGQISDQVNIMSDVPPN